MAGRLAGLRILVVDDTEEQRYILERWLSAEGAQVDVAASAREAIDLAARRFPSLAVVDLAMPGQDGFYLVSRLRALERELGFEIPVVAISVLPAAEVEEPARRAGFDAFVERPTDAERLVAVLRALALAGDAD